VAFGKFVDVIFSDLLQRQAKLVRAGRDVPEHITELVLELAADLVIQDAAVITLDLFDDVRNLAGLAS